MNKISIVVPKSWNELADTQLYYLYSLLADNLSLEQVKTYCLFKWGHMRVVCRYASGYIIARGRDEFRIDAAIIENTIHALDWIGSLPSLPVRITKIKGHRAIDSLFQSVPFETYICCDNLYQGYLESQNSILLDQMAELLYGAKFKLNQEERISIFYWFATLKDYFSKTFCHFLQPADHNSFLAQEPAQTRVRRAMNTMIRALTKGDITKEHEVLSMDTWRALTELDEQAREYEDMKRNGK